MKYFLMVILSLFILSNSYAGPFEEVDGDGDPTSYNDTDETEESGLWDVGESDSENSQYFAETQSVDSWSFMIPKSLNPEVMQKVGAYTLGSLFVMYLAIKNTGVGVVATVLATIGTASASDEDTWSSLQNGELQTMTNELACKYLNNELALGSESALNAPEWVKEACAE